MKQRLICEAVGCVAGCRLGRPLYCTADTLHSASGSCNATTMHHSHLRPPTHTHTSPRQPVLSMQCVFMWDHLKHEKRPLKSVWNPLNRTPVADCRQIVDRAEQRCRRVFFFAPHLVQQVSGLGERHRDAGAQVAAGSVAVGQAGYRPFSLQREQTHLNHLAEKQHRLGQRVSEAQRDNVTLLIHVFDILCVAHRTTRTFDMLPEIEEKRFVSHFTHTRSTLCILHRYSLLDAFLFALLAALQYLLV